jgi:CheY-like chemotaxis protein
MPDISGLDVLKQIRACSVYGGTKIIAYTAYATHDDKDHLMGIGFDAVLIKPITSSQLLEIL